MDEKEFGEELDKKFDEYRQKPLSAQLRTEALERKNDTEYDAEFHARERKCQNPLCGFPLANDNYRVLGTGDVCRLCYDMYHAVHERTTFVEAHRLWKDAVDEAKSKRAARGDNNPFDY